MVPLTSAMIEVLDELPRVKDGDYLLSNTLGKRPIKADGLDDWKKRLDQFMVEELRKMADERGENSNRVTLPHWVNHDLRRTVRTRLSSLRVADVVAEAVIAHVRPGIKGVYDLHNYADEKREALTLWNGRLHSIVEPPASNVVELAAARA